jgi:hypothetical protein
MNQDDIRSGERASGQQRLRFTVLQASVSTRPTRDFEEERSYYTVGFLEDLRARTTGKVLVIWDQVTWHTTVQVEVFLKGTGRFGTLLLPTWVPKPTQWWICGASPKIRSRGVWSGA